MAAASFVVCGCHSRHSPAQTYQDAQLKFRHGDLAGAYQESQSAYREYSATNSDWALRFQTLGAEILVWRGLGKDALALLAAPVPSGHIPPDVAVRRNIIQGQASYSLGRFAEARLDLATAEALAKSSEPDLLGDVSLAQGSLSVIQNDFPSAESSFRKALQIARERKKPFLETKALGSLGRLAMIQERYDEAIDWYEKALDLALSISAEALVAKTLGNEGWNYYKMGDLEKAADLFARARTESAKLGLNEDELVWLTNIGTMEYDIHSYVPAEQHYQQALDLARKLDNKAATANCLNNLAHVAVMEQKYDQAEQYNREALALERSSNDRSLELFSLITESYIATGNQDFPQAESELHEVLREKTSDSYLRWQAEAALANVYAVENRPVRAEEYFRNALTTIDTVRSSIKREDFRLSFLAGAISLYDDYIDFLVAHHKEEGALQVAEASSARTLAEGLGINSASISFSAKDFNPRQVAKRSDTVLLDYWLGADHSYLWVITPERVESFTLPAAAEIDPLVQSYRQALLGSRDVLETRNVAGQKLYDLLVAPAAKLIPKGSRVTILPDGSLYGLNFETLLAPAPQLHYWIEDVDVSYANSLTLLAAGAARHASPAKTLLLVGDAVSPDAEFPKLPQAAAEMSGIENYFPGPERTVFAGVAATPEAYFDSQPQNFSYIHFVAHGTASRTSPLDSAVILSKQGDNYKLYARDIIQHPLHADLVTISACHGEGVRTYSGEGLVGLSWAFLRAGAHGVIAALWEVNDNSTPQLMDHLYSAISRGVPPAVALRDAKLALLHSGTVYRRPFYWAPFQFYRGA
ncbi:MAG: CHAT domain-containing protein [Candidatus Acidiferrales bacterium]